MGLFEADKLKKVDDRRNGTRLLWGICGSAFWHGLDFLEDSR